CLKARNERKAFGARTAASFISPWGDRSPHDISHYQTARLKPARPLTGHFRNLKSDHLNFAMHCPLRLTKHQMSLNVF
ncbi:MAG: hypothetical protein P4M02_11800, partial [Clostridia bacterium]|nr:hypothetical protein [Clostridia bacterium]